MRRRFMITLVGLTIAVVLLYAIPRAIWVVHEERESQQAQVDRIAALVADVLSEREQAGRPVTVELLDEEVRDDEWAMYTALDGTVVATRPGVTAEGADVVSRHQVDGGGTLVLARDAATVTRQTWNALQALVVVGVFLIVLAFASASRLARRLARPFQDLADAAERLGRGDFDVDLPRYGVPEVDDVGVAMRDSAQELRRLLDNERELTVHASHELRTPLTAMQLELEDLAAQTGGTPEGEQVRRVLGELARLQAAVGTVLGRAQERGAGVAVDVTAKVRQVVARWQTHASCRVVLDGLDEATARTSPRALGDALHRLLGYVCATEGGDIAVGVKHLDDAVQVTVAGSSTARGDVFTRPALDETAGAGRGEDGGAHDEALRAARDVAAGLGARLTLAPGPTTTFVLTIPCG